MKLAAFSVILCLPVTSRRVIKNWSVWAFSLIKRCSTKALRFIRHFSSAISNFMRIINKTKNTVIAEQAAMADTVLSLLKGLLGRDSINPGEALIITQCRSIHMFFMKFGIDVIFV